MAAYGRGQMLGVGIDPRLMTMDYSPFVNAAATTAQSNAALASSIGGAIKDFGEAKEQRKKIDAETKASRAGIESAIKLGDALGFDVKGMLSPVLDRMDDPNTTPIEAAALGREASTQIANVLNLGFKAKDQEYQRASLTQDAAYKNEQLRIAQQNANSRAQTAIAAGGNAPPLVDVPLGDGSNQKMQWDRESQSYIPISVSGLSGVSIGGISSPQQSVDLTELVKGFEGFNPNAYNDYKQTSIGFGTRGKPGETITEEEASNRLQSELTGHAERIREAAELKGVSLNENQFKALTSFDYNTGRGANLIERFGDQPDQLAAKMLEYTKAGGEELTGLVKRRQIEAALFLSPEQQAASSPQLPTQNQNRIGFTPAEAEETYEQNVKAGGLFGQRNTKTKEFKAYPGQTGGRSIKFNPETGQLEIIEGSQAGGKAEKAQQAKESLVDQNMQDLYFLEDRTRDMAPGVAGAVGRLISQEVFTTKQAENKAIINRISSRLTLGTLQSMRENSPTGGALGNVSDKDIEILRNSATSLSNIQSPEEFDRELIRLQNLQYELIHGSEDLLKKKLKSGEVTQDQFDSVQANRPVRFLGGRGEVMSRDTQPSQKPTVPLITPGQQQLIDKYKTN